jgi:outer membrane protein assembly factor BamB
VFLGDGTGHLGEGAPSPEDPFATIPVGSDPRDIAAEDVNHDGKLDLVTADSTSAAVGVLIGLGTGNFTPEPSPPVVGPAPIRLILANFDRDGLTDLASLDGGSNPAQATVLPGTETAPFFDDGSPLTVSLGAGAGPEDLAVGDLDADGRDDLVATETLLGQVVAATNTAGPGCPHTSLLDAPRAHLDGNGPVAVAVADLNEDGLDDLVTAAFSGSRLEVLLGTGNGYSPGTFSVLPSPPQGIASADFNVDGHADVVVALGDQVQLFVGNGTGMLAPGVARPAGTTTSAVVAGDFNGDGAPDAAATARGGSGELTVFLGDGLGGLTPLTPVTLGGGPQSLDAGDIDNDGDLDIVVARAFSNDVVVLEGVGDGTFTPHPDSPLAVGTLPFAVALGHLDGDALLDVATADNTDSTVTVWFRSPLPTGGFVNPPVTLPAPAAPLAVAALDVTGDGDGDVTVGTGASTLAVLPGNGDQTFDPAVSFPVRSRPSAIARVDADADGRPDLVVPCRDADSVVVLLSRPPGFAEAPRVAVGTTPTHAVAADLDADGDADLAVVDSASDTVTVLENDGLGTFTPRPAMGVSGAMPVSVAVADFDRDGVLDLVTSNKNSGTVSVLLGDGALGFSVANSPAAGVAPDDLVAGDFDRDGDLDLAVCNYDSAGKVAVLLYDHLTDSFGAPTFFPPNPATLGNPTAIFSGDLNGDGILDLAVANDSANTLAVALGDGSGAFPTFTPLALTPGDTSPLSVAGGDLDGDGDLDLATVGPTDALNVFENIGGTFATPLRFAAAYEPQSVVSADVNRDGKVDLLLATDGLNVLRGDGALGFGLTEGLVAGLGPGALAIDDFDRDGRPDVAVVNRSSNDVSILLSSACLPRRLVLSMSPSGCGTGLPPYLVPATVQVQDDGGNRAECASGEVVASIWTGNPLANLTGDVDVALTLGEATFTSLAIDQAGARYRLAFDHVPALPPPPPPSPPLSTAISRSFTLGASVTVSGPSSVCSMDTYSADPGFDSYAWTLDLSPHGFGPTTTVGLADGVGPHTLAVDARVDGCVATDSTSVYVGNLASVTITPAGPVTVCVDCLGGTVTAAETGGGPAVARQWGYRENSGVPPIVPIPGQTSDTYVVNGLDFPGVGTYYLVETTTPTCGSPLPSNEIAVTITPDVPTGEVRSLGATSRGPSGVGENVLQWVNTTGDPVEVLIRWNQATLPDLSTCAPPADPFALADGEQSINYTPPAPSKDSFIHGPLALDTAFCYSIFVKPTAVDPYSPGRTVKARPFNTTDGPVKWAYATGATAIVPPTVALDCILVMSNDRSVHCLERGEAGGEWPSLWVPPVPLNGVVHSRSPVTPVVPPVNTADNVLFVGEDSGGVTAINTKIGQVVWAWAPPPVPNSMITGAPGAFFARWGGPKDVVLFGTHTLTIPDAGIFYTLDLYNDGVELDSYDGSGNLGPVMSTPTLDYSMGRAYFTSWGRTATHPTVWCVEVDANGLMSPCTGWTFPDLDDITASPVLANDRVYVANVNGQVYSLDADTGAPGPPLDTLDGPVKGFLFPDRRGNDLYFATDTKVWSVTDTAGTLSPNWTFDDGGTLQPSMVLHWPQTDYLFFGSGGGKVYQLNIPGGLPPADPCTAPSCYVEVLGGGVDRIGAPSLDIGVEPPDVPLGKKMLVVGSVSGKVYSVVVPLPWP